MNQIRLSREEDDLQEGKDLLMEYRSKGKRDQYKRGLLEGKAFGEKIRGVWNDGRSRKKGGVSIEGAKQS
jgi:hypothetical protein